MILTQYIYIYIVQSVSQVFDHDRQTLRELEHR